SVVRAAARRAPGRLAPAPPGASPPEDSRGRSPRAEPSGAVWRRDEPLSELRGLLDHLVGLDHVVLLDLVPPGDHHAALVALLDLADVVLEPAEAADLALVDLDRVPDDPQVCLAGDLALDDHAAGDRTDLGDRERLADVELAHRDLALDRREQ